MAKKESPAAPGVRVEYFDESSPDFEDVKGHESVKRALMIAVCGGHSATLIGPRKTGKSMLIKAANRVLVDEFQMQHGSFYELRILSDLDARKKQVDALLDGDDPRMDADIHIEVAPVSFRDLFSNRQGTSRKDFVAKIKQVIAWKTPAPHERGSMLRRGSDMTLSEGVLCLLKQAFDELGLTADSAHKVIRVARTIANMDGSEKIAELHVAEAVQYRLLDRKF